MRQLVPLLALTTLYSTACTPSEGADGCLSDAALEILGAHVSAVATDASYLAESGSSSEALAYFELPGWTVAGPTFFTLLMPCGEAVAFDEWCDGGVCWQLECTAPGPAWAHHGRLENEQIVRGEWTYADTSTSVSWDEASGVLSSVTHAKASSDAGDYDVDATLVLDAPTATIDQTYPSLVKDAEVKVHAVINVTGGDHSGSVTLDGTEIALLAPIEDGFTFEQSGACAP